MSAAKAENQLETTNAFIAAWKRLSVDEMAALRTPDCVQINLPSASISMPKQNNDGWIAGIKPMFSLLSDFNVDVRSITNDAQAGRAVIHAKTSANMPVGPYQNEHVMIISFAEDGRKMTCIEDMMDSVFVQGLMGRVKEYLQKQKPE